MSLKSEKCSISLVGSAVSFIRVSFADSSGTSIFNHFLTHQSQIIFSSLTGSIFLRELVRHNVIVGMAERVGDDQVADVTLERALRDDDGDGLVPAIGCRRRNSRCSSRRRLSGLFGTGTVKRMVRLVVVLSSFFALIENFALFIERILRALVSLMNEENTLELELLVAPLASSCLYKFVLIFQMKLGKALSS